MIDDPTLLRSYAAEGDADAFAEIVRRHLSFVYATALRRLGGDAHRAQDVTQIVFCALARDAGRVARQPVLGGWLHTATRNAVINLVRSDKRRRTREEEASHMQRIDSGDSADWSRLRPVLDSALDRLGAQDREAVLARFFQGRSFGEIGASLGLSEEAARKRVDRALGKLRDLLRPHGIASTSAALSAVLLSQPASAAPAGLLGSVTSAALSSGSAVAAGTATFFAMTKLQVGVAAAVLLAGTLALITQQRTIVALRHEASVAQARLAQLDPAFGKADGQTGVDRAAAVSSTDLPKAAVSAADKASPSATARGEVLAAAKAALNHGKVPERYFAFMQVLQKLTRDNWREVLQAFEDEQKRTGLGHPEVYEVFVRRAGEVAGKDAINYFLETGWRGGAYEAMIGWAAQKPEEALHWLSREANAETRRNIMGAAIRGLALTEPDLAVKTLESQPPKERDTYATEFVTSMLRSASMDEVGRLVEGMIGRAAQSGSLKAEYLKHVFFDYSSLRLSQAVASGTVADTARWLGEHAGQPYLDRRMIAETSLRYARQDPQETLRWLESVNTTLLQSGEQGTVGYRVAMDAWRSKDGAPVVEAWLRGQTFHPHYDQLASQYAALEQDTPKALGWANTIKGAALKQQTINAIYQRTPRAKS